MSERMLVRELKIRKKGLFSKKFYITMKKENMDSFIEYVLNLKNYNDELILLTEDGYVKFRKSNKSRFIYRRSNLFINLSNELQSAIEIIKEYKTTNRFIIQDRAELIFKLI